MLERGWRILASILVATILLSSSFVGFTSPGINNHKAYADNLSGLSNETLIQRVQFDLNTISNLGQLTNETLVVDVTNDTVNALQNKISTHVANGDLPKNIDSDLKDIPDQIGKAGQNILSVDGNTNVNQATQKVGNTLNTIDNKLSAFINKVQAQSGKKISVALANELIGDANNIIANNQKTGNGVLTLLSYTGPLQLTSQVFAKMKNSLNEIGTIVSILKARGVTVTPTFHHSLIGSAIEFFDSFEKIILLVDVRTCGYAISDALLQTTSNKIQFTEQQFSMLNELDTEFCESLSAKANQDPSVEPLAEDFYTILSGYVTNQNPPSFVATAILEPTIEGIWKGVATMLNDAYLGILDFTGLVNSIIAALSPPAACITPPSGLVGWWPGDGNTNDLIGGHTGTITGGVTFAPGKVAQAFSFDGTGSVGVGSLGINSDTQPFSIVTWINPSASAISDGLPHIIAGEGSTASNTGNDGEYFSYISLTGSGGLGKLSVEIGATQTYSDLQATAPVVSPNQWSLVAVTYDGSRTPGGIKIYLNGVEQPTTSFGSGFTLTGSPRDQWAIGSQIGVSDPFSGLIDETEIFNTAVTQGVIQSEFAADSAGKCKPGGSPTVIANIPLGAGVTNLAVNPNTNTVYTSDDEAGTGVSSVINGNTNKVITSIPIGTFAIGLAVNPNTNTVYVQSSPTLLVINGNTNTVTASLSGMGLARYGVAVNPNTNTVYVTSNNDNLLYVLNGATNTVVTSIPVGTDDSYDAVNPSTNTIYVTNYLDNTVSVINGNTNTVTATIPVGNVPYYLAANPTTNAVYVVNAGDNTVSVIDGNTNTVTATIPVGSNPVNVAVNPLTNTIYVANSGSNTVSVINGNTNTVTGTISGFNGPFGIAFNIVTNNIYVANSGNETISVLH